MKKYRKKQTTAEAIQFTGENHKECREFLGEGNYDNTLNYPNVLTPSGHIAVSKNQYIIKDRDTVFLMSEEGFKENYEEA